LTWRQAMAQHIVDLHGTFFSFSPRLSIRLIHQTMSITPIKAAEQYTMANKITIAAKATSARVSDLLRSPTSRRRHRHI
jgi:hypothetical protein